MTNPAANSVSTILSAAAADRRRADARIVVHKSRYREPFLSISLVTVTPLPRNVYSDRYCERSFLTVITTPCRRRLVKQ